MEEELNATGYNFNETNYTKEFKQVLQGVYACYTMMLGDNVSVPPNDENEIRNMLLFNYLNKYDGLMDYTFNGEVLEPTGGRVDIKVQTPNKLTKSEAYYIIECKRLDNKKMTDTSGLNADYINEGIYRFVSKHYSTNCRVNAMIGFVVEEIDIHSNTLHNINTLLRNPRIKNCNTIQNIRQETFIRNFEFHYSSVHNDCDREEFMLYHLMFDFSGNISL
jgi:hypothetical protein